MIETCEGTRMLIAHGAHAHGSFLEVFLLRRNMSREMLGGFRFLAVWGALARRSFLEVFLIRRNINR